MNINFNRPTIQQQVQPQSVQQNRTAGDTNLASSAPQQNRFSNNFFGPQNFLAILLPLMLQLLQFLFQGGIPGGPGTPAPTPTPGGNTNPIPLDPNAPQIPGTQLDQNDLIDYIWAQSNGGNPNHADPSISSIHARPGSRLANAGPNEFDAAVAANYANQFKAYALNLDTLYDQGDDLAQLGRNLETATTTPMAPEAEMLAKVAAIYRGDIGGGSGAYDNPQFGGLVNDWMNGGLQQGWLSQQVVDEIRNDPNFGQADVQTIGAAVKVMNNVNSGNAQQDSMIRQSLLNSIFDFNGNTPSSPFGAVPTDPTSLMQYQEAIAIAQDGTFDELMSNYRNGIQTSNPVHPKNPVPGGGPVDPPPGTDEIPLDFNFRNLTNEQRSQIGLIDEHRAAEHLWGRQMIAEGHNDGGILVSVLQDMMVVEMQRGANQDQAHNAVLNSVAEELIVQGVPQDQVSGVINQSGLPQMLLQGFTVADGSVVLRQPEVDLSVSAIAADLREFGGITGRNLDRAMATTFQESLGVGFPIDVNNAPLRFANGPTRMPVSNVNDLNAMAAATGLSPTEQMVMRLWSHDRLMPKGNPADKGQVTGNILAYTLAAGGNALDAGADPAITRALLEADIADDGVQNGSSLESGFGQLLPKLYGMQTQTLNAQQMVDDAFAQAQARGMTPQQIQQSVTGGVQQAIDFATTMVEDHPMMAGLGTAGLAAMSAACPYMAGPMLAKPMMDMASNVATQFTPQSNVQLPAA